MHELILLNDEGEHIKELVSDTPWRLVWIFKGKDRAVLTYQGSGGQILVPADHITVLMAAPVGVLGHA